ncbi:MAG: hypothetical protein CVV64_12700 [Candidatus Wallbacteria bacterium HGW-Wallbacteria-1]|jgi:M6 family metalloprotease-like protein|uniref:P/Homo B domain-containing protein n=1 Tax=Candidatus Wallbacteria bacterium HGW-Wallbacteria-1 TaxID=2013854 RepID=A0A2N1PN67_9BACT|nr:MAG: hypothetical protein CVV64_12700 [Candidatus Wallbacteria bacterium HGW-Wallbacteria-1]
MKRLPVHCLMLLILPICFICLAVWLLFPLSPVHGCAPSPGNTSPGPPSEPGTGRGIYPVAGLPADTAATEGMVSASSTISVGTTRVLCIPVDFPGYPMTNNIETLDNNLSQVTSYFNAASGGRVTVLFSIAQASGGGPFRMSFSMDHYGANTAETYDALKADLMREAILAADAVTDFSNFDSVMIFHAGPGEELSGVPASFLWSAHVPLSPAVEADGIRVVSAMCMPETYQPYGAQSIVGVTAHEFGHELGLPDLYDTTPASGSDSQGIGIWGLMGSGNWLGDGATPSLPCAWSRAHLGWDDPVDVTSSVTGRALTHPQAGGESLRVWIDRSTDEYFLLENRFATGWDASLPGQGLLVWHINGSRATVATWHDTNQVNGDEAAKLVDLEEADGASDLDQMVNPGDSTDPFAGPSRPAFGLSTNPSSRRDDGSASGVEITSISAAAASMSIDISLPFEVSACVPVTTTSLGLTFTAPVDAVTAGAATSYSLQQENQPSVQPVTATVTGPSAVRLDFAASLTREKPLNLVVTGVKTATAAALQRDPQTLHNVMGTNLGGYIFSARTLTNAGSPYLVTRDVVVAAGSILTLGPGCTVLFDKITEVENFPTVKADMVVFGRLLIQGTTQEPVNVASASMTPAAGDWGTIYIASSADPATLIENLVSRHSVRGVTASGIFRMAGCTVENFDEMGVALLGVSAAASVVTCNITGEKNGSRVGVYFDNDSLALLHGCLASADTAVMINSPTTGPVIRGCSLHDSTWGMAKFNEAFNQDAGLNHWSGNSNDFSGLVSRNPPASVAADMGNSPDIHFIPLVSGAIAFLDQTWTNPVPFVDPVATVRVQFSGTPSASATVRSMAMKARSSVTDTSGIYFSLTETGPGSGVYRGTFTLAAASSQTAFTLGVAGGEDVTVTWPGSFNAHIGRATATVGVGSLPSAPTLQDPGSIDYDGIYQVSWTVSQGATSYELQEDDEDTFTDPVQYMPGNVTSRDFTGKLAGTWFYRVRGINANGPGPWSNVQDLTVTPIGVSVLSGPSGVDNDGQYNLSWTLVAGVASYELQEDDNTEFTSPDSVYTGSSLSTTLSGRADGRRHYRVRAQVGSSYGAWSNVIEVVVNRVLSISGRVRYEDRLFTGSGFTGTTEMKPARYVQVEIARFATPSTPIASTMTDATGLFSMDLGGVTASDLVLLVQARGGMGGAPFSVRNTTSADAIYTAMDDNGGGNYNNTSGDDLVVDVQITLAGGFASAFNILDTMVQCQITLEQTLSAPPCGQLYAYWANNSNTGTYYTSAVSPRLLINGSATDPDDFDDVVIAHEFAHFVMDTYSRDDSPGGNHSSLEHTDIRLAWSEGWATWFACFVRSDPYYVDTNSGGVFSYEIETPTPHRNRDQIDNEASVSSILWDITDTVNESFDGVINVSNGSFDTAPEALFDVVANSMPSQGALSLEDFWFCWFNGNFNYGNLNVLTTIFKARNVSLVTDIAEDDDDRYHAPILPPGSPVSRTFYAREDQDWITFQGFAGVPVAVESLRLLNRCDTNIAVYNADGQTLIGSNDNHMSGEYCSRYSFTPPTSGFYMAKVTTLPQTFMAEYGSYSLLVQSDLLYRDLGSWEVPDNGDPLERIITATGDDLVVKGVWVRLMMDHPAPQELTATLVSPAGTSRILRRNLGASMAGDNIIDVWYPWEASTIDDLTILAGEAVTGQWKLQVQDSGVGNIGQLMGWVLRIAVDRRLDAALLSDPGDIDADGTYNLLWDPLTGAETYQLQESALQDFAAFTQIYAGTSTSFQVGNKSTGTWYYRVRGVKQGVPGPWSNVVDIQVVMGAVEITSPNFGQNFTTRTINQTIAGICSPTSARIEVNSSVNGVSHVAGQANWSYAAVLVEGANTFVARAFDQQGISGPSDSMTITLDTLPPPAPVITTNGGAALDTTATTVTIMGTCSSETVTLKAMGSTSGVIFSAGSTSWSYTGSISPGTSTLYFEAIDQVGNVSTRASIDVRCDPFPPANPVISTNNGQNYETSSQSLALTGWCSADTAVLLVNGSTTGLVFTPGQTSWIYSTTLAYGGNTFTLMARDAVGNQSGTVSITVTFTPEAVETAILSGPSGPINYRDVRFSFGATVSGATLANATFSWKLTPLESSFTAYSVTNYVEYKGLSPGVYTFQVVCRAPDGRVDATPALRQFTLGSEMATGLCISEVYTDAGAWIEIFNPSSDVVSLTSWKLDAGGLVHTFGTVGVQGCSYLTVRENSWQNDQDNVFIGKDIPFVPGGQGYVSLTDPMGGCVDFLRWGGSVQAAPAGASFDGNCPSPASGQTLARDEYCKDTDAATDFTVASPTPSGPNIGVAGSSGTGTAAVTLLIPQASTSTPRAFSGFGADRLTDGVIAFNDGFAADNGGLPVEIIMDFGKAVEVFGVTIYNDGQYGAGSVTVKSVGRPGTPEPITLPAMITSRSSLKWTQGVPVANTIRFGPIVCTSLVFQFSDFVSYRWFQLNEIEVLGRAPEVVTEQELAIMSAISQPPGLSGYGAGKVIDGSLVFNSEFAARHNGQPLNIILDLGAEQSVAALEHFNDGPYGAESMEILGSSAPSGPWTLLTTKTGMASVTAAAAAAGGIAMDKITVPATLSRYLMLRYTAFRDPAWLQIAEVKVLGTPAQGWKGAALPIVSAVSTPASWPGYGPWRIANGEAGINSDFAVLNSGAPVTITLDMGRDADLTWIDHFNDTTIGASSVDIQTAPAGVGDAPGAYSAAATFSGLAISATGPAMDRFPMAGVKARFIKLVYNTFHHSRWFQVAEIRAFGSMPGMDSASQVKPIRIEVSPTPFTGFGGDRLMDGVVRFNGDMAVRHNGGAVTLIMDLGAEVSLSGMRHINDGPYGGSTLQVALARAATPDTFTSVGSFGPLAWTADGPGHDWVSLGGALARKVRVTYDSCRDASWLQVAEITLYRAAAAKETVPCLISGEIADTGAGIGVGIGPGIGAGIGDYLYATVVQSPASESVLMGFSAHNGKVKAGKRTLEGDAAGNCVAGNCVAGNCESDQHFWRIPGNVEVLTHANTVQISTAQISKVQRSTDQSSSDQPCISQVSFHEIPPLQLQALGIFQSSYQWLTPVKGDLLTAAIMREERVRKERVRNDGLREDGVRDDGCSAPICSAPIILSDGKSLALLPDMIFPVRSGSPGMALGVWSVPVFRVTSPEGVAESALLVGYDFVNDQTVSNGRAVLPAYDSPPSRVSVFDAVQELIWLLDSRLTDCSHERLTLAKSLSSPVDAHELMGCLNRIWIRAHSVSEPETDSALLTRVRDLLRRIALEGLWRPVQR